LHRFVAEEALGSLSAGSSSCGGYCGGRFGAAEVTPLRLVHRRTGHRNQPATSQERGTSCAAEGAEARTSAQDERADKLPRTTLKWRRALLVRCLWVASLELLDAEHVGNILMLEDDDRDHEG